MTDRKKINIAASKEDIALFQDAMRGVKRLNTKNADRVTPVKNRQRIRVKTVLEQESSSVVLGGDSFEQCGPNAVIFFACPGLQQKTVRQLRQGKIGVERTIDLHAKTISEARSELQNFLSSCELDGIRVVLIIHGKGTATLKSAIFSWLKNYSATLAISSAVPKDGGLGASYVLLRKNNSLPAKLNV